MMKYIVNFINLDYRPNCSRLLRFDTVEYYGYRVPQPDFVFFDAKQMDLSSFIMTLILGPKVYFILMEMFGIRIK